MRRLMWLTAGLALAAVPAVFGLTGNPALSRSVPVPIPSGAVPVTETQINLDRQARHDADTGSGNDGADKYGPVATPTPRVPGNDDNGPATSPTAIPPVATAPPDVSGKHGRGADDHHGDDHHGDDHHGADHASPTASPKSGKTDFSPAEPDKAGVSAPTPDKAGGSPAPRDNVDDSPAAPNHRGKRPDATLRPDATRDDGSGNDGPDDSLRQGGGSGGKLPF